VSSAEQLDAVVVGHQDYRESDRIVRLLTPTRGRVDALARGARKSRRRFSAALDIGNALRVTVKRGRGSLDFLEDVDLVDDRLHIRTDLVRITLASFACELCASAARADRPEPRLFGLLQMALTVLDATEGAPAEAWRAGLSVKAATFAGLRPHLTACAICAQPATEPMGWRPLGGGAVHKSCDPAAPAVSLEWLQAVHRALRTPLRHLVDATLPAGPHSTLSHSIEDQLGRPFATRILLDQLTGGDLPR
jgi:DNA repair protein RecO (recombination protein O)